MGGGGGFFAGGGCCFVVVLLREKKVTYWPRESYFWPPFEPDQTVTDGREKKSHTSLRIDLYLAFYLSKCRLEKTDDFREVVWRYIGQLILCMSGFCTTFNKIVNEQIQLHACWFLQPLISVGITLLTLNHHLAYSVVSIPIHSYTTVNTTEFLRYLMNEKYE